jgi:mannosyltransferase OCH1-like enzyme
MQTWKQKLSGYELMLWNFDRFDIHSSIWVKQAFEAKKYAFAADYIRLYAVYHYGGIYLDMDVKALKNFDSLLDNPSFIGFEQGRLMEAAIFGANKHAAWIKHMLDYYENREFIDSSGKMDLTPLPNIMSGILHANYNIPMQIDQIIRLDGLTVYPARYFMHVWYSEKYTRTTEDTYTLHLLSGAWLPKRLKLKEQFLRLIGYRNAMWLSRLKCRLTGNNKEK